MADYYPLIARAVQGLPDPAPEMRAAVYDRARTALFAQLRSLDPPLSEEEFEAERDALETAIANVEAEYAGATMAPDEPETADSPPPDAAPPSPSQATPQEPLPQDPLPQDPRPQEATSQGFADRGQDPHAWSGAQQTGAAAEGQPGWTHPEAAAPAPPGGAPSATMAPPYPANQSDSGMAGGASPDAPGDPQSQHSPKPAKARPRIGSLRPKGGSGGGLRAAIVAVSLIAVIGVIAFVAYWLSSDTVDDVAVAPPPVEAPDTTAPQQPGDERIEERLGDTPVVPGDERPPVDEPAPEPPRELTPPEGGVAQRAILYEEDQADPSGEPRASAGGAVWELLPPESGETDPRVRAMVQFPDVNLTMTMVMERNLDPTLPASHTIEIMFETDGRESRNVRDIGLLQLKEEEVVRGAPIAGLPVPIDDNFFLIGLSNVASDVQRNRNLLTQRNWIDIPIRFAGGQRAIISFEKGFSGDQAIAQAFAAWE